MLQLADKIDDLDFYEENLENGHTMHFILYNEHSEAKPACDVGNFWGSQEMLTVRHNLYPIR